MLVAPLLSLILFALPQSQSSTPAQLFDAASAAQAHGDLPTAIRDYQRLVQMDPKPPEIHANLGAALAEAGRFDEAIEQYRIALQGMPNNAELHRDLGLAFYKKNDLPAAVTELQQAAGEHPGNVQSAILLGDCELRLGKAAEAVTQLTPLAAANDANPDFAYVLGAALVATGKRREGATLLQRSADVTHAADTYFLAGSAWLDVNSPEQARKDLGLAATENPAMPHVETLLGMACDHTDKTDEAVAAFKKALAQNANDFDANIYLGAILLKQRQLPEAKPYLEHALQLEPKSDMAIYQMARFESISGDYAGAVTGLEAVVKSEPNWLDPHVELATVYYKLRRPEEGARERATVARLTAAQQAKGPGQ